MTEQQPRSNRRPRRLAALVLAVVLALAGAGTIAYSVTQQDTAPQPSGTTPGRSAAPPAVAPSSTLPAAPPRAASALDAAAPTFIRIPAIDVASTVNQVGLNPDRTMEVPREGPRYDEAAWYRHSPTPGEIGPSVIIGHIDSATGGPSVFFELGRLKPGQRIDVTRADDVTVTFEVDSVVSYPKDAFPLGTVYGDTDGAALRLITCGGSFDNATGDYRDNTVVFAHLVT